MSIRRIAPWLCILLVSACDEPEEAREGFPPLLDPAPPPLSDQPEPRNLPQPGVDALPYQGKVTALYLVPQGEAVLQARHAFFTAAMATVRDWYAIATGGETFAYDVTIVYATHPMSWFECHLGLNHCFGQVHAQLTELGYPVYAANTNFFVAVQGENVGWGGAMAESNGGLEMIGADQKHFQQLIDLGCAPGGCASPGLDGDLTTGGIAHELGHGLGLPHTEGTDAEKRWAVMAEHWHFPRNGFVNGSVRHEIDIVRAHPLIVGQASGPVCGDLQCTDAEDCNGCALDCPTCDAGPQDGGCAFDCAEWGYVDGLCVEGWLCTWPCIEYTGCTPAADPPADTCDFYCQDYGYADGQCVEGWSCTWPCIAYVGC